MTMVEVGRPELADSKVSHKIHGSWNDPLLQSMQKVCRIYVGLGTLGSVVGAYLGQKEKTDKPTPPVIYSYDDMNVDLGYHMWYEYMPVAKLESLINKTNPASKFSVYPGETRAPWEKKMPHHVLEGTGYLSSDLLPIGEYFKGDPVEASRRITDRKNNLLATVYLMKNTKTLKSGQIQRQQYMTENIPDVRLTRFYRDTTHCYTDKLMRLNFNIGEFTWSYMSPRIKERDGVAENYPSGNGGNAWKWGVPLRDKLLGVQNLGLVVTPGHTDDELHAMKSVTRQMPPLDNPLPTSAETEAKVVKLCEHLNESAKKFVEKRTHSKPFSVPINVYYKYADLTSEVQDGILHDIKEFPGICDASISPECLTEDILNVRISLSITDRFEAAGVIMKEKDTMLFGKQPDSRIPPGSPLIPSVPSLKIALSDLRIEDDDSDEDMDVDGGQDEVKAFRGEERDVFNEFKDLHRGQAWVLIAWESDAQQEVEDTDYTHHGFDTKQELVSFLKGLMDRVANRDANARGHDNSYFDGYNVADEKLEEDLTPRIVYKKLHATRS